MERSTTFRGGQFNDAVVVVVQGYITRKQAFLQARVNKVLRYVTRPDGVRSRNRKKTTSYHLYSERHSNTKVTSASYGWTLDRRRDPIPP
jgi:hypothetical protein